MNSVYDAAVADSEKQRLEDIKFPHDVSCTILKNFSFTSLIDAGAGPDARLAQYVVRERKAKYAALDFGKVVIDGEEKAFSTILSGKLQQLNIPAQIFYADICNIPSEIERADIVHERFVLMHLSIEKQRKAIQELIRIAKTAVVLLEYNWNTIRSTQYADLTTSFLETSCSLGKVVQFDPLAGETLKTRVPEIIGNEREIAFWSFPRPEGDYTAELIQLCTVLGRTARLAGSMNLANKYANIANRLQMSPITCVFPEIVAAVIWLHSPGRVQTDL
jgi:hypothetical protein